MLSLDDILVGFVLASVVFPPAIEKAKSAVSKTPLPSLLLNTASLKITIILLLSEDGETDVIVGAFWSNKVVLLLFCVTLDILPAAS